MNIDQTQPKPTSHHESPLPSNLIIDKSKLSMISGFDDSTEKAYWHSRTPAERLQHMEILRRINYGNYATNDFKEFLKLLKKHKADYLLIGGYAVGYTGTRGQRTILISGLPFPLKTPNEWSPFYGSLLRNP